MKKIPLSSVALLLPLLAACQQNGFVRVTVEETDGGRGLPAIYQIRSIAADADGGTPSIVLGPPETDAIVFPKTFVVEVPPSATTVSEIVEGIDQSGNTVLRGSNTTTFSAGSQAIPLQVNLTQACNNSLDCNPAAFCQGELFCTAAGACVANATTAPPGFGTACGNDGGRCNAGQQCISPFGLCGDGTVGTDPLPDGGAFKEACDWGNGVDAGCTGPDGGCNSLQPNHCRPNCVLPSCGDGIVDNGEKCDLGALNGTEQGCNASCTLVGTATKIAGNGDIVDGGHCTFQCYTDGPGADAMFQQVSGIAIVGTTLYVADTLDEVVRAIDLSSAPAYNVTTLAGNPAVATTMDGTGSLAGFFLPLKPFAYQGTLLLGTGMNVAQITLPAAVVTTFAGPSTGNKASENNANGIALDNAFFNKITGIALDPASGDVYTIDQGSGEIRQIIPPGPGGGFVNDLAGQGMGATFQDPTSGVVINGGLFLSDTGSEYIRRISLGSADGGTSVTNVAGNGGSGFADSSAPGGAAFSLPAGMCTDNKTIYIADQGNKAIRQLDPVSFKVTTVLGGPDAGIFDSPFDCAWDSDTGTLYVSDQSSPQATPDGVGNVIYMVQ